MASFIFRPFDLTLHSPPTKQWPCVISQLYEIPHGELQLVPNKLAEASDDHRADDPYCPNDSLSLLVDRIKLYVAGETEKPLELFVSSEVANSFKVKEALSGRGSEYENGVLTVLPMPTRIHNSSVF